MQPQGIPLGTLQGVVKWFRDEKGFGFLSDSEGRDFFVHFSGIVRAAGQRGTLQQDQRVTFEGWKGDRGLFATDVRPIA
jgi:CspA family cold shock protein